MRSLACLALLLSRANRDNKAILADKDLAHKSRIRALKILIGAAITVLAQWGSMAATITVHEPDGEGRVFVDVVGKIEQGDFETFKKKTDQIYPIRAPKNQVIVMLMSHGGLVGPAMQIGELVLKRGMTTFVPGDRTCASACTLIWVAGWPRTVGDAPQIGFHAAYNEDTGRETGAGNAVIGAYLRDFGFSYNAIYFMTHKGPTSLEWLTPDIAKEKGVTWSKLQPPRAIPVPQQPELHAGLQPPPEVITAWSKLMPRPVTAPPEGGDETIVVKRALPSRTVTRPERSNEAVVVKQTWPKNVTPTRDDYMRWLRRIVTTRERTPTVTTLERTPMGTLDLRFPADWVVTPKQLGPVVWNWAPVDAETKKSVPNILIRVD
jgi:hypothetical protein